MRPTKKLLKQIVATLESAVFSDDYTRFKLARDLHWAKNVVIWKLTEYRHWKGFCRTHVKMGNTAIFRYIATIDSVEKYKYTDEECLAIIASIGWGAFVFGIADINRKMAVKRFIKTYGRSEGSRSDAANKREGGDRAYAFSLPVKEADLFDMHLINYGMSIHPKGRRGVRDAMIKLVDKKLK